MVIKKYPFFQLSLNTQNRLTSQLSVKLSESEKEFYKSVLNGLQTGLIEYEPIEIYEKFVTCLVYSTCFEYEEYFVRIPKNVFMKYGAASVAFSIARRIEAGKFVLKDKEAFVS